MRNKTLVTFVLALLISGCAAVQSALPYDKAGGMLLAGSTATPTATSVYCSGATYTLKAEDGTSDSVEFDDMKPGTSKTFNLQTGDLTISCLNDGNIESNFVAKDQAVDTTPEPTATATPEPTDTPEDSEACFGIDGLTPFVWKTDNWASDAYLPLDNRFHIALNWRPWTTDNKSENLVWLVTYGDPMANGQVDFHVPMAYVVNGEGHGIWLAFFKLDNRAVEQLTDRGESNPSDPFDVACDGDWSGQCRLNDGRMSLYLDAGKYSVLTRDGSWLQMSNWHQVLLPPKGDDTTFVLAFDMGVAGNFRFHLGGAENDGAGGWHSEIELPLAEACR